MADTSNMPTSILANPAPLGLLGFGMTTILLSFHNIGLFPMDSAIISLGIFYGGLAQIFAGIMEFKRGNTFGMTAFTSYGLFWMAFVIISLDVFEGMNADSSSLGIFFMLWGVLTLFLLISILHSKLSLKIVFVTLTALFFIISIEKFTDIDYLVTISGILGVICGCSAMYCAFGEVLCEQYGKEILPLG